MNKPIYQSSPKDLSAYHRRKDDDEESVKSTNSNDSDKSVKVSKKKSSTNSSTYNPNPNPNPKSHQTGININIDKKQKEGFTTKNTKNETPVPNQTNVAEKGYSAFMSAPDMKDKSLGERIKIGIQLVVSRLLMICFVIIFGINIEYASNRYGNDEFFPTDRSKPPYYPTPEELQDIEETKKHNCKTVKQFRNPGEVYPEYLYYRGMVLPNRDPCVLQGASTDGWLNRFTAQWSLILSKLISIFTKTEEFVESQELQAFKQAGKEAEGLVLDYEKKEGGIESTQKQKDEKLREKERKQKEELRVKEAKERASIPNKAVNSTQTRTQTTQSTQSGKGKSNIQTGGSHPENIPIFGKPKHIYSQDYNPYAADRERKISRPFYPFWPIFANSTQMTAVIMNYIYKLFYYVIQSPDAKREKTSQESILQISRVLEVLMKGLFGIFGSLLLGSIVVSSSFMVSMITSVLAMNTSILWLWYPVMFLFSILLFFTNIGIVVWRTLYFHIMTFIMPLFSLKDSLKEFGNIILNDRTGFFILTWLIVSYSSYQVANDDFKTRIILYSMIIPLFAGTTIYMNRSNN